MKNTNLPTEKENRHNSAIEKYKSKYNITKIEKMAKGGFGSVHEVHIENKRYAIKVIDYDELINKAKSEANKEINKKMIDNECTYLTTLNHKNLLKGISKMNFPEEKIIIILMFYCENSDLQFIRRLFSAGKLYKNIKLEDNEEEEENSIKKDVEKNESKDLKPNECLKFPSETFMRYFALQILNGLKYLHECGVVHCDLKLTNILVTRDFIIKIGDFGTMKSKKEFKNIPNVSTKNFQAPEFMLGLKEFINEENVHKFDLYSFGVILYVFFFNKSYIDSTDLDQKSMDTFKEIYHRKIVNNKNLASNFPKLHNLLQGLLHPDINERYDIHKTYDHDWFRNQGKLNFDYFCELHDNDSIKLLLELQKIEFSSYLNNKLGENIFEGYEHEEGNLDTNEDYEIVSMTD